MPRPSSHHATPHSSSHHALLLLSVWPVNVTRRDLQKKKMSWNQNILLSVDIIIIIINIIMTVQFVNVFDVK